MIRTSWWMNRRAKTAANNLQRGLMLVEATADACSERQDKPEIPSAPLRQAKTRIKTARRLIEELDTLSFNDQSRFFRQFEQLEECLDYAAESIVYEEFGAARVDLCRSGRAIQETMTHLHTQTGVKPHKPMFPRLAVALAVRTPHQHRPEAKVQAEIIDLTQAREKAAAENSNGSSVMLM
jgi:hypothetical protein